MDSPDEALLTGAVGGAVQANVLILTAKKPNPSLTDDEFCENKGRKLFKEEISAINFLRKGYI